MELASAARAEAAPRWRFATESAVLTARDAGYVDDANRKLFRAACGYAFLASIFGLASALLARRTSASVPDVVVGVIACAAFSMAFVRSEVLYRAVSTSRLALFGLCAFCVLISAVGGATTSPYFNVMFAPLMFGAFSGWHRGTLGALLLVLTSYAVTLVLDRGNAPGTGFAIPHAWPLQDALELSLAAFLLATMARTLGHVVAGGQVAALDDGVTDVHAEHARGFATLSARELEVVMRLARGLTNREIADEMFLSPRTVEGHVARATRKCGFENRTALAVYVARRVARRFAADGLDGEEAAVAG